MEKAASLGPSTYFSPFQTRCMAGWMVLGIMPAGVSMRRWRFIGRGDCPTGGAPSELPERVRARFIQRELRTFCSISEVLSGVTPRALSRLTRRTRPWSRCTLISSAVAPGFCEDCAGQPSMAQQTTHVSGFSGCIPGMNWLVLALALPPSAAMALPVTPSPFPSLPPGDGAGPTATGAGLASSSTTSAGATSQSGSPTNFGADEQAGQEL
mmetsp:Transcript_39295/g.123034  ORF Transcript_39295/g.123034 Transcript_39295/m.123034 type:complete len:211 (-) Transcript_39295:1077-1709(-)